MRSAYRVGYVLARAWWRIRRPSHRGALVAIWAAGRLLLVRQSYQRLPAFPGGGVHDGEAPRDAARRELAEELGLRVAPDDLVPVCVARERWDGRRDTVAFFELHLAAEPALRLDRREIVSAAFVAHAALPPAVSRPVGYYLAWRRGTAPP